MNLERTVNDLQDVELEKLILGYLINYSESPEIIENFSILKISDFYHLKTQVVFESVLQLKNENVKIDIISITNSLKKKGQLQNAGGVYEVSILTNAAVNEYSFKYHLLSLKELSTKRMQYQLGLKLQRIALNDTNDIFETNEMLSKEVSNIVNDIQTEKDQTLEDIILETNKQIENALTQKGLTGVPTGFISLDKIYGGRQNGNLIIIAGRPGMGKTAYAMAQCINAAILFKKSVAFFSLEMTSTEIMKRIFAFKADIDLQTIKDGTLTNNQWSDLHNSQTEILNSNLHIIDNSFSLTQIINKIKLIKYLNGLDLVCIDYLQLIGSATGKGDKNRVNEVSEISRTLKMTAQELKIPIIALSQLSRDVEKRGGSKMPILSDLRDSGSLEQDANIVEFVYRPEYYGIMETEDGKPTDGKAYILIKKNRDGACKDVEINFSKKKIAFFEENFNSFIEPNNDFLNKSEFDNEPPF